MTLLLGRLAILVVLGVCETGGTEGQTPRLILVFGDSLAQGLTYGIDQALADAPGDLAEAEVEALVVIGAGLIPRRQDMRSALAERLDASPPVDAVIISMGVNDVGMPLGGAPFYGETWQARYAEKLRSFAELPLARGVPLVWLEVPALGNPAFAGPVDATIRPVQAAELDVGDRGVIYVPTLDLTTDGGSFISRRDLGRGEEVRFREGDGIHFTAPGYVFLGQRIVEVLADSITARHLSWPVGLMCHSAEATE